MMARLVILGAWLLVLASISAGCAAWGDAETFGSEVFEEDEDMVQTPEVAR